MAVLKEVQESTELAINLRFAAMGDDSSVVYFNFARMDHSRGAGEATYRVSDPLNVNNDHRMSPQDLHEIIKANVRDVHPLGDVSLEHTMQVAEWFMGGSRFPGFLEPAFFEGRFNVSSVDGTCQAILACSVSQYESKGDQRSVHWQFQNPKYYGGSAHG